MTSNSKDTAQPPSENLAKARQGLKDELDVVLQDAQDEALNSRAAFYMALAKAYAWYQRALSLSTSERAGREYLKVKFENHAPPITKKEGVSEYNRVAKLVFNMTAPKYAATVSKYTMVLDYLDRVLSGPEHDELRLDPGYVVTRIDKAGSIEDCIQKQRAWLNEQNQDNSDNAQKVADHLKELSTEEYKNRTKIGTASGRSVPTEDGFVLLLGRVNGKADEDGGAIDIVDVLETETNEVESYVAKHALKDTSSVGDTINLLGDTLGLASVIKGNPITTVEQGGKLLLVSLGKEHSASVIVQAQPKNGALAGFNARATLGSKGREWFEKHVMEAPRRRLFDVQSQASQKAVVEFAFSNVVTKEQKVLHFNAPTETTKYQVTRDRSVINEWQFEFDMDMAVLEHIYSEWLNTWKGTDKNDKEKRIITVVFSEDAISFNTKGSKKGTYTVPTGIKGEDTYSLQFRGDELVGICRQLRTMPGIGHVTLRGHDSGILEIEADTPLAIYTVDLPTVLSDFVNHNPKNFAKLR